MFKLKRLRTMHDRAKRIDVFSRSLAASFGPRAVGIVLSGANDDGSLGIRAISNAGGMTMAQEPTTADHDTMPRSAIATGLVEYVLPPAQMPGQLLARFGGGTAAPGAARGMAPRTCTVAGVGPLAVRPAVARLARQALVLNA